MVASLNRGKPMSGLHLYHEEEDNRIRARLGAVIFRLQKKKTPKPTPEPKPQERPRIQSFVPLTAEQA